MFKEFRKLPLENEEQRALKWFLGLFYCIYIFYEIFYHLFYKNFDLNLPQEINFWMYATLIAMLPLPYYFKNKNKINLVKYIFVITYFLVSIISELNIFSQRNLEYQSGNAIELLMILFTPFFINIRFFWVVSTALVFKYVFFGIVFNSGIIFAPISLVVILSGIAFMLLKRFQIYVDTIKKSYDSQLEGIVKGVIATIELKDPYTRGHSERVAFYANSLAKETGLFSDTELNSFNYACLLHDIGKVNIPDTILMKPGKLTKEEFDIIKTHPGSGAEAIMKVNGLEGSIQVIKFHHERWDGKGYPDQLNGENIPLLARIVSVADAFDAMTSSRSYREAIPVEEAYKRILNGQGTQFDPNLVELFKKVYPDWKAFHKNYSWSHNLNYVK